MAQKSSNQAGWLSIIGQVEPQYCCPLTKERVTTGCSLHGCALWISNTAVHNCMGAFAALRSMHATDRIQANPHVTKDKASSLKQLVDGKLTLYDIAYAYNITRPKAESLVEEGAKVMQILAPLFAEGGNGGTQGVHVGPRTVFTHTSPVAYKAPSGEVVRVCVCCETQIEDEDGMVLAYVEKAEVAWCSRECAAEFPMDAYMVAHKFRRHWVEVALDKGDIDERSRVREITPERMECLKTLALEQGYK
jgi:hypothetical protein